MDATNAVQLDEATVEFTNAKLPEVSETVQLDNERKDDVETTAAKEERQNPPTPTGAEPTIQQPSSPLSEGAASRKKQSPTKPPTQRPAPTPLDAKRAAERAYNPKPAFINVRYHEDRVKQNEEELRLAMEAGTTAAEHQAGYSNFHPGQGQSMASVVTRTAVAGIAPSMHRATVGGTSVLPTAMRVHPRGFKMLSQASPIERRMRGYFRLPAQPPLRVQEEHAKLRAAIRADIIQREQKRLRLADKREAQESQFGGTSNAVDVTTTVTVTVRKPNGGEETYTEQIAGKQLDGYLLLENATKHLDQRTYKSLVEKAQRRLQRERAQAEKVERKQRRQQAASSNKEDNTFLTGTGLEKVEEVEESEEEEESSDGNDDEVDATLRKTLLEHTGNQNVPTPESAVECTLNDRRLVSSVEVDLGFFTNLTFLDVGENRLLLSDLRGIPNIEEIHLHCNDLTQLSDLVGEEGDAPEEGRYFQRLHTLNISFNRIPSQELAFLCALPALQCLDLSHNKLRNLSIDFASAVPSLTHLSLESNGLQNGLQVMTVLSQLPSLTEVNLNHNRLEALPSMSEILAHLHGDDHEEEAANTTLFPCLAVLGLAHNRLEFFEDVLPVVQYQNVARLALWGNPVVKKSRDTANIQRELVDVVGIEVLFDHPVPSKRSTQDFYSTRPPERDANGRKKKWAEAQQGAASDDPEIMDGRIALHTTLNSIFNNDSKPGATRRQQYRDAVKLRGPSGRFLQLPDSIHADHQLRSMKSLGLSRTTQAVKNTPGTGVGIQNMEAKRKVLKQEAKALKALFNPNRPQSSPPPDPQPEKRPKDFKGNVSRPPPGPASYTAPTKSAHERQSARARDFGPLPSIPHPKPVVAESQGPMDTRTAMAELRRMIRKPLPPLY